MVLYLNVNITIYYTYMLSILATPVGKDVWLFGPEFTAGDISACMFMYRLNMLGLGPRYFSPTVRPTVFDYYNRLMVRPSVVKTLSVMSKMVALELKKVVKKYAKRAAKLGLVVGVVGVAYLAYKQFKST